MRGNGTQMDKHMSMSLGWEPVRPSRLKFLDDALKFAIRKRYGGTVDTVMTSEDVPYLEGLRDAGVKDAKTLIEAIEKYGSIYVREE